MIARISAKRTDLVLAATCAARHTRRAPLKSISLWNENGRDTAFKAERGNVSVASFALGRAASEGMSGSTPDSGRIAATQWPNASLGARARSPNP